MRLLSSSAALPALSCVLMLVACGDSQQTGASSTPASAGPVPVEVRELRLQDWQLSINAFGVIEALEEVNVAAELSGTVAAVHVDEGDRVTEGQLLLELDPRKRQLALAQAEQQVQRARAGLEEARLKLQRRRDLAERESVSREILDNAQLAVDGANAAFQQALAARDLADRELADTRIYSPTDGLVDVQAVEVGEPVQAGARLVTLQAVQGLRAHTWVSEADIANIRAGASASVSASGLPGLEFPARVEWVGVNADPGTGNFPVKLVLAGGEGALRPGMTATVVLQGIAVEGALLLPEAALVDRDRRRVVFVVEDGVVRMREPLLAAGFSDRLRILSGLSAGERVVVAGQGALLDGTAVTVRGGD